MALSNVQITALNTFSSQESSLLPAATPGLTSLNIPGQNTIALGSLMNNGLVLADVIRNGYESFNLCNIPAPGASAATATMPLFVAPSAGNIVSAQIVFSSQLGSVTSSATATELALRRINNANTATFGYQVSLASGLTAGVILTLPTGTKNTLLSNNVQYSVTASGMNVTLNCTQNIANNGFLYVPAAGDYVVIDGYSTNFAPSTQYNTGCYTVNAATANYIYMSKQSAFSFTASNVGSATASAADIASVVTVGQYGVAYNAGDIISLQVAVPAGNVTSTQNLNTTAALVLLTLKPATF